MDKIRATVIIAQEHRDAFDVVLYCISEGVFLCINTLIMLITW